MAQPSRVLLKVGIAGATLILGLAPAGPVVRWQRAAVAQTPRAEAPSLNVGEEWRWTNGMRRRIIAVEGDEIVTGHNTSTCQGCRAYRDRNLTITKVVDKNGAPVDEPGIGHKILDFPLTIGKKWESKQMLRQAQGPNVAEYKDLLAVEAYEPVTTKAGTFSAFRITHVQERAHNPIGNAVRLSWRETLWYSPDAKAIVKREVNTGTRSWGPDWEIESFSVK